MDTHAANVASLFFFFVKTPGGKCIEHVEGSTNKTEPVKFANITVPGVSKKTTTQHGVHVDVRTMTTVTTEEVSFALCNSQCFVLINQTNLQDKVVEHTVEVESRTVFHDRVTESRQLGKKRWAPGVKRDTEPAKVNPDTT